MWLHLYSRLHLASMKVPPKRKGNPVLLNFLHLGGDSLNESPSEKEGKSGMIVAVIFGVIGLNESPSEKEGKCRLPTIT